MLNILVIGSGGREHAIVRALARSKRAKKIWCAPGNPGIAQLAECLPLKADDIRSLVDFAVGKHVDLVVIGPEAPLVLGLSDQMLRAGVPVFGPSRTASRLEGSKSFAKEFMTKYGLPTARYEIVPNLTKGTYLLTHWPGRSVVKADGLAAGKGVKVCKAQAEARDFLYQLMENEIFGAAGSTALIEECLDGQEATVMAFCDGETLIPMPASQDHKRLEDDDQGPNTGGMGAYAPAPLVTAELEKQIKDRVFAPFLKGLQSEKFDYRGVIYFGLMITPQGPKVLEFNVRFGDPETQVVLPLLESDLVDILEATANKTLKQVHVRWKRASALTVVLAAAGYPDSPIKGDEISGLKEMPRTNDLQIYYAGVDEQKEHLVTAGGRVLDVTAIAPTLGRARDRAYEAIGGVRFKGMQFRKDIGAKALEAMRI